MYKDIAELVANMVADDRLGPLDKRKLLTEWRDNITISMFCRVRSSTEMRELNSSLNFIDKELEVIRVAV